MLNAGYLNVSTSENGEVYRGRIATMDFARNVIVKKTANKLSDKAPDYDIYTVKEYANVGAAWKKQGKNREYLSIRIDDPSMKRELSLMGFKRADNDGYDIVWKRQS